MIEQIFIVEIFRAKTKFFYWNLLIRLCKGFFKYSLIKVFRKPTGNPMKKEICSFWWIYATNWKKGLVLAWNNTKKHKNPLCFAFRNSSVLLSLVCFLVWILNNFYFSLYFNFYLANKKKIVFNKRRAENQLMQ